MNPDQSTPPKSPEQMDKSDPRYASALASMAAMEYQLEKKPEAPQKHIISKKFLIYCAASVGLSILLMIGMSVYSRSKGNKTDPASKATDQLLKSAEELQDLQQ